MVVGAVVVVEAVADKKAMLLTKSSLTNFNHRDQSSKKVLKSKSKSKSKSKKI